MQTAPKRIEELDALRGIASLLVVIFHFSLGRYLPYHFNYVRLGNTGVELFFLISGFVIFMSINHVKKSFQFVKNRFSRLYPTYWTAVTFTYILILFSSNHVPGFKSYLGNMTMFQYYLNVPDLDGPYWTMIVELNFYIFIVMIYRLKLLKYITPIGIAVSIFLIFVAAIVKQSTFVSILFKNIPLLPYFPLFFSGILFYKFYILKEKGPLQYAIIILMFLQIGLHGFIRNQGYTSLFEYALALSLYFAFFFLFINNKLFFFVNKATLFFGEISFALYLIHQYLSINLLIPWLMNVGVRFIFAAFIAFITSVTIALIMTRYVDIPFRKLIRKRGYR